MKELFSKDTAEAYDAFYSTSAGARIDKLEKREIGKFLSGVSPSAMLEVGCGTGHWTAYFSSLGFSVVGIDASENMLAVAKRKNIEGAVFHGMDAEDLDFPDGAFKVVTAITVFEFLINPDKAVSEIRRVLSPGGLFVGGFLNAESELGRKKDYDPVVGKGRLFRVRELADLLAPIGKTEISGCVRFLPTMEIIDDVCAVGGYAAGGPAYGGTEASKAEPAFLAVRVRKA